MRKQYRVELSDMDRHLLHQTIRSGTAPARTLTHARILLKADEATDGPGWSDKEIADAVEVSIPTIERVRKRAATEGVQEALGHKPPRRTKPRKLDGIQEAHLIALACSAPPRGKKRWTVRLLADRFVTMEEDVAVSRETVRQVLKKANSSLI